MTAENARAAVICDFDGTATTLDIGDEICRRFADPSWEDWDRRLQAGELTLPEAQERMWPLVRAARAEVLAYVRAIARLRPGFERFVREVSARRGARFVIASGGLAFYIEEVLGPLRAAGLDIEVLANEGRFVEADGARGDSGGGRIEISFPHRARLGCTAGYGCAVCKGRVVDELRAASLRTTFIGDGRSDRCAAGRADALFAVEGSSLARWCAERAIPHRTFTSFDEVLGAH